MVSTGKLLIGKANLPLIKINAILDRLCSAAPSLHFLLSGEMIELFR